MAETEDSRERRRAYLRAWKAAHPHYQREWMKAHPGYQRDKYWNDPEAHRAKAIQWTRDNPHWSAFTQQRSKARQRGIEFLLTFEEWLMIWEKSGKWDQRGCRKDQYVMARFGDDGPYKVSNVRICTVSENYADRRSPNAGWWKTKNDK